MLAASACGNVPTAEPTDGPGGDAPSGPTYELTVVKTGDGIATGTISASDLELDCGPSCTADVPEGRTVTLTASTTDGWFTGWYGEGCSGTGTCVVVMSEARNVTATFQGPHNIMFVTSTTVSPHTLGGTAGADAFCQARANAANLPGTYRAWISTSTIAAPSRFAGYRGWVRPDGRPFADSIEKLLAGQVFYAPRLDERGDEVSGTDFVGTGTNSDGSIGGHCSDWTDDGRHGSSLSIGRPSAGTFFWSGESTGCATAVRLYCFSIGLNTPLVPAVVPGRVAFVSSGYHLLGGGIEAADAACQSEASGSGISGTFRALLATTTATAASRFSTSGPVWVRRDGVPLAESAEKMFDGTALLTSFSLQGDGTYVGNYAVWSGASGPQVLGTSDETCADWTSTSTANDSPGGYKGRTGMTDATYFAMDTWPYCGQDGVKLHCLQE